MRRSGSNRLRGLALLVPAFIAVACGRSSRTSPSEGRPAAVSSTAPSPVVASAWSPPAGSSLPPAALPPLAPLQDWPEVQKLEPTPPAATPRKTAAAACEALARRKPSMGELEKLVAAGDACAMSALADVIVAARPLPEGYRRALGLAQAALDAGAAVDCRLIELGGDDHRIAACYDLSGSPLRRILFLFEGRGVPRDVPRARELLSHESREFEDCSTSRLRSLMEEGETEAPVRRYQFCRDVACITPHAAECMVESVFREEYRSAEVRARARSQLGDQGQARFDAANRALIAYARAESMRVYMDVVCGTIRNGEAIASEWATKQRFEQLVSLAFAEHSLPPAPSEGLDRLAASIAAEEKKQRAAGIANCDPELAKESQGEFRKALSDSSSSYRRYEDAIAAVAETLTDGGATTSGKLRGLLRAERLAALRSDRPEYQQAR